MSCWQQQEHSNTCRPDYEDLHNTDTHQNQDILRKAVTDHFTYIVDIRANVVPRMSMHSVENWLFTAGVCEHMPQHDFQLSPIENDGIMLHLFRYPTYNSCPVVSIGLRSRQ